VLPDEKPFLTEGLEMVPTTGLEPINGVFSLVPMVAAGVVFMPVE
jgi:hypothetical protein